MTISALRILDVGSLSPGCPIRTFPSRTSARLESHHSTDRPGSVLWERASAWRPRSSRPARSSGVRCSPKGYRRRTYCRITRTISCELFAASCCRCCSVAREASAASAAWATRVARQRIRFASASAAIRCSSATGPLPLLPPAALQRPESLLVLPPVAALPDAGHLCLALHLGNACFLCLQLLSHYARRPPMRRGHMWRRRPCRRWRWRRRCAAED